MESYQQQLHPYMRPPPPPPPPPPGHPPMVDLRAPFQGPPPVPPPGSWYSGQFQYHHHSHSPSPPPPPPPGHQWGPHSHSDHFPPPPPPQYAVPHPNPPYTAHPLPQSHYPPLPPAPRHPLPSYPHPNSQSYPPPQLHQEWGNPNLSHQSSWNYPADRNEEDWASRARAWAASRSAMENQHQQSQLGTVGRLEEQSHYPSRYPLSAESQYQDIQQPSGSMSGYQSYPVQDEYYSYTVQDGNVSAEAGSAFSPPQQSMSSSVHQQEVPSSYSSVPGKGDAAWGKHHFQLPLPVVSGSLLSEPAQFAHTNQSVDPMIDPRDQPLEFTPRFTLDNNSKMPSMYEESAGAGRGKDSLGALPALHPWSSSGGPGVSFPSVPSTFPPATQLGSPLGVPPHPMQHSQMFGPSSSFSPAILSIAAAAGPAAAMIHADAYGVPIGSERPKKAAVPNWLREEIIKKKSSITGSVPNHLKEETQSIEDEAIDKSVGKGDQADSKSIDSLRSTEEEEDDEDYVEAARTVAINQEIKRILTEVLLKVTDELFDEIATKVLSEDDAPVDANHDTFAPNHKLSPSPALPAPKATTKVLIPVKARESDAEDDGEKTGSGATGNVLGLANYASDDEEEENQSLNKPVSSSTLHHTPVNQEIAENVHDAAANGHPHSGSEDPKNSVEANVTGDNNYSSSQVAENYHMLSGNFGHNGLLDNQNNGDTHSTHSFDVAFLTRKDDVLLDGGKVIDGSDASNTRSSREKLTGSRSEFPCESDAVRKATRENSHERDTRQYDRYENKRSSSARDSAKDIGSSKVRDEKKADDNRGGRDEKQQKKDKIEDKPSSKERSKVEVRHPERTKEADSREQSLRQGNREGRKEPERVKKVSDKYDVDRKQEQNKDEMAERLRHKVGSEASEHKRRHSPSLGSRRRNSKDKSMVSYSADSSDEASDEYRRKQLSKRNNRSPSPSRSIKRRISRSPKRSQRRHSPYSSLEMSRGRRSRSRSKSPVRRQR
ncbi:hypothetical protein Dimus_032032, partial [Dionaea muscipula]